MSADRSRWAATFRGTPVKLGVGEGLVTEAHGGVLGRASHRRGHEVGHDRRTPGSGGTRRVVLVGHVLVFLRTVSLGGWPMCWREDSDRSQEPRVTLGSPRGCVPCSTGGKGISRRGGAICRPRERPARHRRRSPSGPPPSRQGKNFGWRPEPDHFAWTAPPRRHKVRSPLRGTGRRALAVPARMGMRVTALKGGEARRPPEGGWTCGDIGAQARSDLYSDC